MRVIDRFHTAAGRPRGPRPSGSRSRTTDSAADDATAEATDDRASVLMSGRWNRHRGLLLLIAQLVVLALVLSASAASAQPQDPQIANDVGTVLTNVRNWIMGILAGLATVFLTIGGVRYVMASGDPGEVEKAKTCFKSAGWGYGLAALAPLVITILAGIVGPGQ